MHKIVILSGAGISAESGIRTFRDSDGLWENHSIMEVCSDIGFMTNRQKVLSFYDNRRADLADKVPNSAHLMIAHLQQEYPDEIINITQNVDDLFEKAGCENVIHLHGELTKIICESCGHIEQIGYDSIHDHLNCPVCGLKKMRHHIVMFGEQAPEYQTLYQHLEQADMLVVIGTSGQVLPVDEYTGFVKYSILNNLEPSDAIREEAFDTVIYAKATEASVQIEDEIRMFLSYMK